MMLYLFSKTDKHKFTPLKLNENIFFWTKFIKFLCVESM